MEMRIRDKLLCLWIPRALLIFSFYSLLLSVYNQSLWQIVFGTAGLFYIIDFLVESQARYEFNTKQYEMLQQWDTDFVRAQELINSDNPADKTIGESIIFELLERLEEQKRQRKQWRRS